MAFSGSSSGAKRIALVAGVVVLLIVLGIAGAVAGKQQTERQRAEAEATLPPGTPVESLSDCPWGEASCVLGLGIERALHFGNVDAVIDFTAPRLYICPGGMTAGAGGPFPLCDGAAKDDGRIGLPYARRYSEGGVITTDELRGKLHDFLARIDKDARDAIGDGALRLYAFSCSEKAVPFQNVSCAREGIILSAIVGEGAGQHRELLIFWAVGGLQGKTLPVAEVWDGVVLPGEVPVLFRDGGQISDLGEVYAIDQSLREPYSP